MPKFDVSANHRNAPGDDYARRQDEATGVNDASEYDGAGELVDPRAHPLDSDKARRELRRLLEWFYFEKEKQSVNRLEMAMDADFYDNIQWDPEDRRVLEDRGQMALVYNEVAPMVDWIIGTERRTRVDWKVMPRSEDDVQLADVKTKTLKYSSDTNHAAFNRSRAFADAAKAGVGWLDDGVRDDPTADPVYNKYEDWRNILHDSLSYELDLSDARYVFRWRWVDEDIAVMMFPDRRNCILRGVEDAQHTSFGDWEEDTWQSADQLLNAGSTGTLRASGMGSMNVEAARRRVRLIEAQYRKPVKTKIIATGPLKGSFFNELDQALVGALSRAGGTIVDKITMRVHIAVFTENDMLAMGPSLFRHNRFSLTPIWCYRRSRDRMPYGVIRRVRDIQQDLNKRASKANWLMSTNQVIMDENAVDDIENLREEAQAPDGIIIKKTGKDLVIRRDSEAAVGQIQMMQLNASSIQKAAGPSQENLGRQTNAVSGEAIKARQLQGSVVTTEIFDNLRLATQIQGEKQLSLVEQFFTEEKVIRLTGAKGALNWVKLNQPEVQPDGTVRFINDITASMADFVVSEADYAGTLRQVMFDALNQMAGRLPPEVALRILTMAMEFSDLPNKTEIADQLRKITGEQDPNHQMTPEEQQAAQQQAQQQQEAEQFQREQAIAALETSRAKVREINARAAKLESEAGAQSPDGAGNDGQSLQVEQLQEALSEVRRAASKEIESMAGKLREAQQKASDQGLKVRTDADSSLERERIKSNTAREVALIQATSNDRLSQIQKHLDTLTSALQDVKGAGAAVPSMADSSASNPTA